MTAGVVTLSPPRQEGSENCLEAGPRWSYVMGAGDSRAGSKCKPVLFLSQWKAYQNTFPSN